MFLAVTIDHRVRNGQGNTPCAPSVGGRCIGAADFVLGLYDVDPNPTNGTPVDHPHRRGSTEPGRDVANKIRMRRNWDFMTMDYFALETEFGDIGRASSTFDLNSRDNNF